MLEDRYKGFLNPGATPAFEFDVKLVTPTGPAPDEDVRVTEQGGVWRIQRGDFLAEADMRTRRGWIRQSANPYSADSLLRIVHTLLLAPEGGFLLHAASAVRNGRAYLFSGVSGAGKTTLSRLAPPDVTLLTDEISYVRREPNGYRAYGTPFAGELGKPGENISAPVGALYFLEKGAENRSDPVPAAEATRTLLRNVLFFAEDLEAVHQVFQAACGFVAAVPVRRLTFAPTPAVWETIG
jgi:hypothetical protein